MSEKPWLFLQRADCPGTKPRIAVLDFDTAGATLVGIDLPIVCGQTIVDCCEHF